MRTIGSFTVAAHGVAAPPGTLSEMQRRLLDLPPDRCVAVVSAPTGSGKSYVFLRAVLDRGERIVFVVPTRRLAENLRDTMAADLRGAGWSEDRIEDKVQVWTSDHTARMKERGVRSVTRWRQMMATGFSGRAGGEIVFLTPEVLLILLMARAPGVGQMDFGPQTFFQFFHRVVFDEFHLVDERMFGLIAPLAVMAGSGLYGTMTRLCLLSATPTDILPTLEALGVPPERVERIEEQVLDAEAVRAAGGRLLHGDVRVELIEAEGGVAALLPDIADAAAEGAARGSRTAVIHDSLRSHEEAERSWAAAAAARGLRFLPDSSISGQRVGADGRNNRERSLAEVDLIVATSTIEVGITLDGLNQLYMEPGFDPASAMQRLGRAGRRGDDAKVVIVIDPKRAARAPWIGRLAGFARERDGRTIAVGELSAAFAAFARLPERLDLPADDLEGAGTPAGGMVTYRTLGARAVWTGALRSWDLISTLNHTSRENQARRIHAAVSGTGRARLRLVAGWLSGIHGPDAPSEVRTWAGSFLAAARRLRDIGPTIRVAEQNGEAEPFLQVQASWLARNSAILERFPVEFTEEGEPLVRIPGRIADHIDGAFRRIGRTAFLPTGGRVLLDLDPLRVWLQECDRALRSNGHIRDGDRRYYEAARALVARTGIIPWEDADDDHGHGPDGAASAIV